MWRKQLIRLVGMVIIGVSTTLMAKSVIGIFGFLVIWVIGFFIYDQHHKFN